MTDVAHLSNPGGPLTADINGVYTLSVVDLAGLALYAPDSGLASISMDVQGHAVEGAAAADSAVQTITVDVTPVADAPVLAAPDATAPASIDEDGSVRSEERRVGKEGRSRR